MARFFDRAENFRIGHLQFFGDWHPSGVSSPLDKLEAHMAPEALDDSAERCDAPKCHPETRVAVQDDLYSWIKDGDVVDSAMGPRKIKWITGPAGTGKTAVMGSVTERCKKNGYPVACFFFSSTGSIGRRTKTAFVTTIAHQLAQHRQDLKDAISDAIEADTVVFKKNLRVQMETLVLGPLRAVANASRGALQGVIMVDGLDECQAGGLKNDTIIGRLAECTRTAEQDQLEILEVLHQASLDPSFPYRIIIASRPERVFREFFEPDNHPAPFAHKLDLNVEYNATDDITLFLQVQFNRIRRRYRYPASWPPPGTIETLVKNASGQFIYAATIIRFLDAGHRKPPDALLLGAILKANGKATTSVNPLEPLDALYTRILECSPDPPLSVLWIHSIHLLNNTMGSSSGSSVSDVHLLLQMDPESNEAEHLLGNLHSLIRIPPPDDNATARYGFYHKSLLDFLEDPERCGKLSEACDELLTPASADWWVSLALSFKDDGALWQVFYGCHLSVRAMIPILFTPEAD
ncbi:hypothetical protein MD484_g4328, partial [Candolleomyces efflorescens]